MTRPFYWNGSMAALRPASSDPIRAYLQGLDKTALVTLILEHADGACHAPKGPDLRRLRDHLEGILGDMRG